jgi:hypothetical protein
MQTVRRLYVYVLSAISLAALVTGLTLLLGVLFDRLGLRSGVLFGGEESIRQQLTVASALTAVSLPLWLIHWTLAERSVRPGRPGADLERTSAVRGLYIGLAMGALLFATARSLGDLVQLAVERILGASADGATISGSLALALVAGAAWGYHLWIRTRDWRHSPMRDAGAWLPRTYLYIAAFVGLAVFIGGINGLIELVGRVLLDEPAFGAPIGAEWWITPLATALAGTIVGGATWFGHWLYGEALIRSTGWRGDSERPSRLRLAYFVVVLVAAGIATLAMVGTGIGNGLAAMLGATDPFDANQTAGLIALPLATAVPWLVAWWAHRRRMGHEAEAIGPNERIRTTERLAIYPAALVGLGFGAVGTAWLISILIGSLAGRQGVLAGGGGLRHELAVFLPYAVLGIALWAWRWRDAAARRAVDPTGEATSTTRRAAVLLALAGGVLAGIASLGFILYRAFGSVFGVSLSANALDDLRLPIAALLVSAAVALFHSSVLRRDQAVRAAAATEMPSALPTGVAVPTAVPPNAATLTLRLTAEGATSLGTALAALRQHLPPGVQVEVIEAGTTSPPPADVGGIDEPA